MKYLCETCERLIPPGGFRVEQGVLVLSCSRCGAETRALPLAALAQGVASPPIPITALLAESGGGVASPAPALEEYEEPTRPIVVPSALLAEFESGVVPKAEVRPEAEAPRPPTLRLTEEDVAEALRPSTLRLTEEEVAAVAEAEVEKPGPPVPTLEEEPEEVEELEEEVEARKPALPPPPPPEEEEAPVPRVEVLEGLPSTPRLVVLEGTPDAFSVPSGFCPKCIAVRKEGARTCPQCGLDYSRFRPEEHQPSELLSSSWEALQAQWEDRGAHDKVLLLATEYGELASLGRLYRIRLARSPEDAMAQRGREEVVRRASSSSALMPSAPPDRRMRVKQAGLGFLLLFMMVAAIFLLQQIRSMLGR